MRWSRPKWMIRQIFQIFFIGILLILLIIGLVGFFYTFFPMKSYSSFVSNSNNHVVQSKSNSFIFIPLSKALEFNVNSSSSINRVTLSKKNPSKCAFHTCFNVYHCGKLDQDRLSIYVYPIRKIIIDGKLFQAHLSQEFYSVLSTIVRSPYYVSDPREACLFVPSLDLLNLQKLISSGVTIENILSILQSHEFWGENGENHILFTMFPSSMNLGSLNTAAIIASSGFKSEDYTLGFHIPIITINPLGNYAKQKDFNLDLKKFLLISMKDTIFPQTRSSDILILDFCSNSFSNLSIRCRGKVVYKYPQILSTSEYCLIDDLSMPNLWDAMSVGCIPVIVPGDQRLPFDEFIDWKRNAIILYKHQLNSIVDILRNISKTRKLRIQSQVRFTFSNYFRDIGHLTKAVLQVMKDRVFPHSGFSIHDWNENPVNAIKISPIFNPVIAPKTGFTAVILAYDRVESLFQVIEQIAHVPSLYKILVVWNNQVKKPPRADLWPRIPKSLKIVQTQDNKMSNRFYPYEEIETEAVLSLDDDIIMLTNDEIEFGYQTWREFPDRIVGFPSRTHTFDNVTQKWKYESEWTNEISMVLTGAAFYHKYWHHAYFNEMPLEIRQWVDKKMNCEDIALNFLVSNRTGKPQIKATPRKKFKCPTCINNEMLSQDTGHMLERTKCINIFSKIYGYMPLIPVEFRADPVLFKVDHLPYKMRKYNDVGTI